MSALGPFAPDPERKRGILTVDDRKYLEGTLVYEEDHAKQRRYERRKGIRQRVKDSVIDLQYINHIEVGEREKIFSELEESDVWNGLSSLLSFVYSGYDRDIEQLKSSVADGVSRSEPGQVSVDADIDITRFPDIDEIISKFHENPEYLSVQEKGILVEEGLVPPDRLDELERIPDPTMGSGRQPEDG